MRRAGRNGAKESVNHYKLGSCGTCKEVKVIVISLSCDWTHCGKRGELGAWNNVLLLAAVVGESVEFDRH